MRITQSLMLMLIGILYATTAASSYVWNNGVTEIDSSAVSQPTAGQVLFDDFVLTGPTTLTSLQFKGGYNGNIGRVDDFVVQIHSDDAGQPNVADFIDVFNGSPTSRTDFGTSNNGTLIYDYSVALDSTFDAGTWWLSIYSSNSDLPSGEGRWIWVHQNQSGANEHILNTGINTLTPHSTATDFQLAGSPVPIPAAAWMFGSVVVLGLTRLRRRA